jgi:acyl-CoA thioesterase
MDKVKRNLDKEKLVTAAVNGSPYYKHVNMKVTEFTDTGSTMEMEIMPEHINVWGSIHGGALAGLVDSSCGTAIGPALGPDESVVTLDLKVQFLKGVKKGKLIAYGRVVHRSRRFVHTESEVFDDAGEMVARGATIHAVIVRSS